MGEEDTDFEQCKCNSKLNVVSTTLRNILSSYFHRGAIPIYALGKRRSVIGYREEEVLTQERAEVGQGVAERREFPI